MIAKIWHFFNLWYNTRMLAQLLSSKPKTNLINLFLAHPTRSFSFTELKLSSGCANQLLKETVKELDKMDFVIVTIKNRVKYYQMNRRFALYPELLNLLRRVRKIPKDLLAQAASRLTNCKLVVLTGVFAGKPRMETDLLFVGRIGHRKLQAFLKLAEKFAEQEVNYTVFSNHEFEYRKSMNDRFVKNILDNNPILAVDRSKPKRRLAKIVYKSY
jgi:DNA-binding HxlR family transcriptional regulator